MMAFSCILSQKHLLQHIGYQFQKQPASFAWDMFEDVKRGEGNLHHLSLAVVWIFQPQQPITAVW